MHTSSYTVWIVDDHPMIQSLLKSELQADERLQVQSFFRGEDALTCDCGQPDFIIMDYHLNVNGLNGLQAMQKALERWPDCQVVFVSGQEEVSVAVEVLKKGALDYIIKDQFIKFNVRKALDKLIEVREARAELTQLRQQRKLDQKRIRWQLGAVASLGLLSLMAFLF